MNTTPFTSTYTHLHRIVDSFECHWYSSFPRLLLMGAAKRTAITVSLFLTPLTLGVDVARALFHPGTAANRIHIIKNTTLKHLALMVSFVFFTAFGFMGSFAIMSLFLTGISAASSAIPLINPFTVAATAACTFLYCPQIYRDVVNDPHLSESRNFSIFRPNPPSTNQSQYPTPRINQRTTPVYRLQSNNPTRNTRADQITTFQLRLMIQGHLQTLSGSANPNDTNLVDQLQIMITKSLGTITSQTLVENKDTIKAIITSHIEFISMSSTIRKPDHDTLKKLYSSILSELKSQSSLQDLLAEIKEDSSVVFENLEILNALLVMKILLKAPDPLAFLESLCEKGESESNKKLSAERTTTLINLMEATQKDTEIQIQEHITAICERDISNKTAKGILDVSGHFLTGYRILSDALVAAAEEFAEKSST